MFGFFCKGVKTQLPPAELDTTTTADSQPQLRKLNIQTEVEEPEAEETVSRPSGAYVSSETQQIRDQVSLLRQQVEAQRAAKEAQIQALHEMQAKQAAYGRDTVQKRPPKAGYATEAEKIMGGSTGYYAGFGRYPGLGYLGTMQTLTQDVASATADVEKALAAVKQVSKDVKSGIVPRTDLEAAIKDLQQKAARAKQLSQAAKGLAGYGESKSNSMWILAVVGILAFLLLRPR